MVLALPDSVGLTAEVYFHHPGPSLAQLWTRLTGGRKFLIDPITPTMRYGTALARSTRDDLIAVLRGLLERP